MDHQKIGNFIAQLRKEKNLTQEDLAQQIAVDRGTISKWERGIYAPNVEMLLKLGDILGVSINEILYGERRNKENEKHLDNVALDVLKSEKRKRQKIFIIGSIFFLILIFLFLTYYFINNYNSIKVYKIFGYSKNFEIRDDIMIVSNDKVYIKLGKIDSKTDERISNIRFYYIKDNQEYTISESDEYEHLIQYEFKYKESFLYDDIKYIREDSYIEITYGEDERKDIIKLIFQKDFSNNSLILKKRKGISIPDKENQSEEIKTPGYVLEYFTIDKENRCYRLKSKKENKEIIQEYFYENDFYVVYEIDNDITESFQYSPLFQYIDYYKLVNETFEVKFSYNTDNKKCEDGECDESIMKYFQENYLQFIF